MRQDLQHLKKIVDRNRAAAAEKEKMEKFLYGRLLDVREAPEHAMMNFWCDTCSRDVKTLGHKYVVHPPKDIWYAFYRALCPEGHQVIRRITDKITDPYFVKSAFVRKEQIIYADAFLTPNDPRFAHLYPHAHKQILERAEKDAIAEEEERRKGRLHIKT